MTKEREENLVARSQESYLEGNSYIFCVDEKMKLIKATQVYEAMKLLFHSPETFFSHKQCHEFFCQNFGWISFSMGIYLFPCSCQFYIERKRPNVGFMQNPAEVVLF